LVWGSGDSSTDGPDWLIGNDDLGPVLNLLSDGGKLSSVNLVSSSRLTLVELLSNAGHNLEVVIKSHLDLGSNDLIRLTEDVTALTVTEDDPVKASILKHSGTGLTSVCTGSVKRAVLSSELHS